MRERGSTDVIGDGDKAGTSQILTLDGFPRFRLSEREREREREKGRKKERKREGKKDKMRR